MICYWTPIWNIWGVSRTIIFDLWWPYLCIYIPCLVILNICALAPVFVWYQVWRASCAGASGCRRASKPSGLRLSRGFVFGSSPRLPRHIPGPRSIIFWTCLSRTRPFPQNAPWLPLLLSILQRCFRPTAGEVILCLPSRPDVGGTPSISPSQFRLSLISPTLP